MGAPFNIKFFNFIVPKQIEMFKLSLLLLVFSIQLNVAYSEEELQVDAEDALNDLQVDAENDEGRRIRPPQIFGQCMPDRCQQSNECREQANGKGKCCVYVPFNRKPAGTKCRPKSKLPNLLTHCVCTVPK